MLRKLLLLCLDPEDGAHGPSDATAALRRLARHWEWVDGVLAAPERLALAAARAARVPVGLDARLGRDRSSEAGARELLAELSAARWRGALLLVGAPRPFEHLWSATLGSAPPNGPRFGSVGLLTRVSVGPWMRGRRSSDPPPLRSELEREGLSGLAVLEAERPREVAALQLAGSGWPWRQDPA